MYVFMYLQTLLNVCVTYRNDSPTCTVHPNDVIKLIKEFMATRQSSGALILFSLYTVLRSYYPS